jgi:hypothetical protein
MLNECLRGLSTRSNLDIVGLVVDVGQDADAVPNPGLVGVGHVARIERAVSHIDQPIVCEADCDRRLVDIVDGLGPHRHQTAEVRVGRTRLELKA